MLKKFFLKIFLILISLNLLPVCAHAQENFPQPQGYVSDYANILSGQAKDKLNALFSELEKKTTAQIAVAIIPELGDNALETYAVDLFAKWGIGQKGKDNGLLLLVAVKEKKIRIETGYGLEGIIPDGLAGEIIREQIGPNFKQGNYDQGLLLAGSFIADRIAKDAGVKLEVPADVSHIQNNRKGGELGILPFIFLVLMIILFIRYPEFFLMMLLGNMLGGGRRGGNWGSGGGSFGGGFGGFGGGMSGGGGSSGGW